MPLKVSYRKVSLPFIHPFTISKGTKTHQPTFLVCLEFMGHKGYGEAPAIAYYNITVDKMETDLLQKKRFIEQFAFSDPERYWHYLHHLLPQNPFLVCAIDMAAWDLYAKMKRKSLMEIWKLSPENIPLTDYTIGIDSAENMIAKMQQIPWPIYKVKVGDSPEDIERVAAIRKANKKAVIRVDANGGWSLDEAVEKIHQLKALNVELVEEPLAKDNFEGMKMLFSKSELPLIADESCVIETDIAICSEYFHGVNIKLTKCSGITPARRMIAEAKKRGMKVMLGCMNESSVGTAALVQLAALVNYLDADGPLLLAEDIATGLQFENGKINIPAAPGLGMAITEPELFI